MSKQSELELEQSHVDRCYARLAELRARVEAWRLETLGQGGAGSYANRFERDRMVDALSARAGEFDVGGEALCFGRLDLAAGDTFHLGRVSVADEAGDPLVVDWRAPIAAAFYQATPLAPLGIVRRRHLLCRGPQVVAVDDDLLAPDDGGDDLELVGEAALLQALARKRTGRMTDIVATIQADQDRAVRAPLAGALIIEGGPGTGKTAVALHRAAYLLYAERVLLEEQGILVVGPSPAFCRYVSQVLPSLGEEGVVLATIGDLAPVSVRPSSLVAELEAVSRLKGSGAMADFLAAAVRIRQRPLRSMVEVPHGAYVLRLTPEATKAIVRSARGSSGTHNEARPLVERLVVKALWQDWQAARGRAARRGLRVDGVEVDERFALELKAMELDEIDDDPVVDDGPDPDDGATPTPEFVDAVRRRPELRRALDRVWPVLAATDLLRDLYGSPALLRAAARRSSVAEDDALSLHRPRTDEPAWSEADLPLLDEATVLLGSVRRRRQNGAAAGDAVEAMLAEQMVDRVMEDVAESVGPLTALDADLAHVLQERVRATALGATGGAAARPDEVRTYGHVVVDEAQELSTMAWRMLRRRCPRRSFTIVGDLDQAGAPGAARSWDEVFGALDHPAGTVVRFNVNYRTPGPVMVLAAAVVGSDVRSAREGGAPARVVDGGADVAATVLAEVERLEAADPGQVAVVAPPSLVAVLAARLGVPAETADIGGVRRLVLDPRRAKGLEFDSVVVVDPVAITEAGGASGRRDLYVSLTRTTDRLTVVGQLPG